MRLLAVVFVFLAIAVSSAPAIAERRVALVMGADRYETLRPLGNAVNDARTMEDALEALGFEVFFESNRDLKRMRRALEDFAADVGKADVALVFFAGHGVEIAGRNMLLPIDANASSIEALKESSMPLNEVHARLAKIASMSLIVLDACRNDPFGTLSDPQGRGAKALGLPQTVRPGFGRVGRAENTLFAFSAAPGETAADGEGKNSPFTQALTKYLGTDGLEIRSVLTLVQQAVYDTTRGRQLPYVESGLPALFFASTTADELPERERLLLAMADVTPDLRAEVEMIAGEANMPLAPLYGALIGSDIASLDRDERTAKLEEAAAAFTKVRDELRTLRSGDQRVTALRREAEQQLSLGAFEAARDRLTEAANIDATSRRMLKANFIERTLSEAATYYLNAGAAAAELKHRLAIADYEKAAALYDEVDGEDIPADDRHQQILTLGKLGDTQITVGNLAGAERAFEDRLSVAKRRADSTTDNLRWQRDLSVSHLRIGDVRRMQGALVGALAAYEKSLAINQHLAASDPANTEWQRDLSISYQRIGHMRTVQGDLAGALLAFESSLAISQRLAAAEPGNLVFQAALSVGHNKIGDVHRSLGNLAEALAAYEASLAIRHDLAASDPDNSEWQRDLSVSKSNVGDVRMAQGDLAGALTAYDAGHAILKRLTAADPGNAAWQQSLSISHSRIGDVRKARGDLAGAVLAFEASLDIAQGLAIADPDNAEWQWGLFVIYWRMADTTDQKVEYFEKALAVLENLQAKGKLAPSQAGWIKITRDWLNAARDKAGEVAE